VQKMLSPIVIGTHQHQCHDHSKAKVRWSTRANVSPDSVGTTTKNNDSTVVQTELWCRCAFSRRLSSKSNVTMLAACSKYTRLTTVIFINDASDKPTTNYWIYGTMWFAVAPANVGKWKVSIIRAVAKRCRRLTRRSSSTVQNSRFSL